MLRLADSDKIRVLHVTEARRVAGTERSLLMLLDNSDASEFDHAVVCRGSGSLNDELSRRKTKVVTIPRQTKADPLALARFGKTLARLKPHIVHIYGGRLEAGIARLLGKPVIERKNIYRSKHHRPLLSSTTADNLLNRWISFSISPSKSVIDHYAKRGYDAEKMRVIYNGVEPAPRRSLEKLQALRGELDFPTDSFLVAFAGRMHPEKGIDVLLRALAQMPENIVCLLAGEGEHRAEYQALAHELKLQDRTRFLGFRTDVRDLFACADAVAIPSLWEPLANVTFEAMAEGKPVVASDVDGLPEAVENDITGYLVPPGDADSLARAITALMKSPELAGRMGATAKRRSLDKYSPDRMARQTEQVYKDVLNRQAEGKEILWQPNRANVFRSLFLS